MKTLFTTLLSVTVFTTVGMGLAGCSNAEGDSGRSMADAVTYRKNDDLEIAKATAEAKSKWHIFKDAFDKKHKPNSGPLFQVKAPVRGPENSEHFWVYVDTIDGGVIKGKYGCDGVDVLTIHLNDPATVKLEDVEDWMVCDGDVRLGGFSVFVLIRSSIAQANGIDMSSKEKEAEGFTKLEAHWNELDSAKKKAPKDKDNAGKLMTHADEETIALISLAYKLYVGNNGRPPSSEEFAKACNIPLDLVESVSNVSNAPH